jgi:MFS family permease
MRTVVIAIACILAASFLLEVGSSLLGVVQPIRGVMEGFPGFSIGGLGSAYYLGFILGCLYIPRFVKRYGHIRAFTAFAAVTGSTALINAFFIDPMAWILLRIIFGFCMAGLYTIIESWLNELATQKETVN